MTVDNVTGLVKEAKATRMTYYVKYETETEQEFANRWFTAATEALEKYLEESGEEVGARKPIRTHMYIKHLLDDRNILPSFHIIVCMHIYMHAMHTQMHSL